MEIMQIPCDRVTAEYLMREGKPESVMGNLIIYFLYSGYLKVIGLYIISSIEANAPS